MNAYLKLIKFTAFMECYTASVFDYLEYLFKWINKNESVVYGNVVARVFALYIKAANNSKSNVVLTFMPMAHSQWQLSVYTDLCTKTPLSSGFSKYSRFLNLIQLCLATK